MSMRTVVLVLTLTIFLPNANAKQPISESLVDCAAIFSISTRAFPERKTEKTIALKEAEKRLTRAARDRAVSEGRSQPDKYIKSLTLEKQQKWDDKGTQFLFSEEFRDWAAYCRSLSKRLNIRLK